MTLSHSGRRLSAGLLLATALAAASCGDSGSSGQTVAGPKRSMLMNETDVVILPTYRDFARLTGELAAAAAALSAEPSDTALTSTQMAWRAARARWKQSEAFRFGPSESLQYRIRSKIDWSPIRANLIEEEIAGTSELTPDYIDSLGTTRRGFLALEYLLFDPNGGDASILDQIASPDGDRRRQYIAALALDIQRQSEILVAAWDPSSGDFRDEFVAAGQTSTTYKKLEDAIDEIVGAMVLLATTVEDKKVGNPAGIPNATPRPENVEAQLSESSIPDLLDNLDSIENTYRCDFGGRSANGLRFLVLRTSPEIDYEILHSIDNARRALEAIPVPLQEAVIAYPDLVHTAYEHVRALRLALAVDLVAALGATPRFTSDGD